MMGEACLCASVRELVLIRSKICKGRWSEPRYLSFVSMAPSGLLWLERGSMGSFVCRPERLPRDHSHLHCIVCQLRGTEYRRHYPIEETPLAIELPCLAEGNDQKLPLCLDRVTTRLVWDTVVWVPLSGALSKITDAHQLHLSDAGVDGNLGGT